MKSKLKVFLDIDGVVANMSLHAAHRHGIELPEGIIPHHFLYESFTPKQFWSKCRGKEFWETIPLYPWSKDLVNMVNETAESWVFLTKANLDDECYLGKARWIRKHFPKFQDKLWIVRGDKHVAASSDSLLIDDHPENIRGWLDTGAYAFHWEEICEKSVDIAQKRFLELKALFWEISTISEIVDERQRQLLINPGENIAKFNQ